MSDALASLLMGASPETVALRALIGTLAESASTVLVTGESGTGKELVARALHMTGARARGPFVPINCGAIPRELIESELFGHRKGSFTGALSDRMGRFELAHGGTLFLDEIGDLPLDMQVKLLRVLQERCVLPVGASKEVPIDVRVVAATHRKLEDEVAQGRFREDLYYRINVLPVFTTPLRQRPLDTQALLLHYAEKFAAAQRRPVRFSARMMALLLAYDWPGNVRELSNLVDRFTTLFPGQEIHPDRIPPGMMPTGMMKLHAELGGEFPAPDQSAQPADTGPGADAMADTRSWQFSGDEAPTGSPEGAQDPLAELMRLAGQSATATRPAPRPRVQPSASNDELHQVEAAVLLAQGIPLLPPEGISLKQHLIDVEKKPDRAGLATERRQCLADRAHPAIAAHHADRKNQQIRFAIRRLNAAASPGAQYQQKRPWLGQHFPAMRVAVKGVHRAAHAGVARAGRSGPVVVDQDAREHFGIDRRIQAAGQLQGSHFADAGKAPVLVGAGRELLCIRLGIDLAQLDRIADALAVAKALPGAASVPAQAGFGVQHATLGVGSKVLRKSLPFEQLTALRRVHITIATGRRQDDNEAGKQSKQSGLHGRLSIGTSAS